MRAATIERPAEASTAPSVAPSAAVFQADLDRFNAAFRDLGAITTYDDGFVGIDPELVPTALMEQYERFTQLGYANGIL